MSEHPDCNDVFKITNGEDASENKPLCLAIVHINLLDKSAKWNFDKLGQGVVQHALKVIIQDYERLLNIHVTTQGDVPLELKAAAVKSHLEVLGIRSDTEMDAVLSLGDQIAEIQDGPRIK